MSPSAQVYVWLSMMEYPMQMLHFAARTKWRYVDGESPEDLPTFSTLSGKERGLMPSTISHDVKIRSWKGFSKLTELYKCSDKDGTL